MADQAGREAITELVIEVFRLNGRLLAAGDRLVADLGLSSARWQVLGAVALAPSPAPVAWIARSMGLARQSVQRLVDELASDGIVDFAPNPHHRRAKLVVLTRKGRELYLAAAARQRPWAAALAEGESRRAVVSATRTLRAIGWRLAAGSGAGGIGEAAVVSSPAVRARARAAAR